MSGHRRTRSRGVNVFKFDQTYVFKHYFDDKEVFSRLSEYYNNQQYRFEVPKDDLPGLRTFLADRGYGLSIVPDITEYVVAVKQYTAHPDNIFKESVMQRSVDNYNCFLMTDKEAVERAVQDGAKRIAEMDLDNPFE